MDCKTGDRATKGRGRFGKVALLFSAALLPLPGLLISGAAVAADAVDHADYADGARATDSAAFADASVDIIVTGSLIAGDGAVHIAPVRAIDRNEITLRGVEGAEELLRIEPGFVPAMGSAMNNGNTGLAVANLHGLGPNRTLVLLDGERLAPADLNGLTDLDDLPMLLVGRVDVLTGGASASYGADAIAGVVNFITRRDFNGLELAANVGVTAQGDGRTSDLGLLAGSGFAEGRGHILLALEYRKEDPVYQGDRFFAARDLDSLTGQESGSPISAPAILSGVSDAGGDFIALGCGAPGLPSCATSGQGLRQIDPSGTAFGPYEVYQPYDVNPWNLFRTPSDRRNAYAEASFAASDAFRLHLRGLYARQRITTEVAPSGVFGDAFLIPLNNPYLSATQRSQLCAYDVNPGPGYAPLYTPDVCAAAAEAASPADPRFRGVAAVIARRAVEAGPRITSFDQRHFEVAGGVDGALTAAIDWKAGLSYGEDRNDALQSGYWRRSRVQQALLAGPDGCLDPGDGCVPVDLFGPAGSVTSAMNDFLLGESENTTRTSMLRANALISGATGLAFPAASPVSFALGGEYRTIRASTLSDELARSGDLEGMAGAMPDVHGRYGVAEGFGELRAPLVEDRPFFHRLIADVGVRYSHYRLGDGASGGHDSWTGKAGLGWDMTPGFGLRASLAHAARAPNIGELFYPETLGLANLAFDPCAGVAPLQSADLRAVCLAQGAKAAQLGTIAQPATASVNWTTAGNPDLRSERSESVTLGFRADGFVPGLAVAADYYAIRVRDVIGAADPADIMRACFTALSAASATSAACTSIQRNPATGGLDGSARGLYLPLSNLGRLKTDGVDFALGYQQQLKPGLKLLFDMQGNWTRSARSRSSPESVNRECAGFYSPSCSSIQPKFAFTERTTLAFPVVDVSLFWRYLGRVRYEPQQLADDLALAESAGCRDPEGADPDGCMVDPAFRQIGAAHYFDLALKARAAKNLALSLRVVNLFDRKPQVVGSSVGAVSYNSGNVYPATYDALGRRFQAGCTLHF